MGYGLIVGWLSGSVPIWKKQVGRVRNHDAPQADKTGRA